MPPSATPGTKSITRRAARAIREIDPIRTIIVQPPGWAAPDGFTTFEPIDLDNVVYSLGYGASRAQARQFVRHGHVQVDGRKITIPSFQVKAGQTVSVKEASRKNPLIRSSVETARGRGVPDWLELDAENTTGKVLRLPVREDIKLPIQEQLIVELYSR